MTRVLLEVKSVSKAFNVDQGSFGSRPVKLRALNDVSLVVNEGECLGLVGESGCGKSTLGRVILRLLEATAGAVFFDGHDLTASRGRELDDLRRRMQVVFQDPYSSLNPRMRVRDIIAEPVRNLRLPRAEVARRVEQVTMEVGLDIDHLRRFPHEFSGGQRQRIGIARALAQRPDLLICDEAVSALDVSIQAQILNLLGEIQRKYSLTLLFISHSLAVVRHISQRIAVMYLGELVEVAEADELFSSPSHPYTTALISAVPEPDRRLRKNRIVLEGEIPSPTDPPAGCYFHTRCPIANQRCRQEKPDLVSDGNGRLVRCFQPGELR